MAVVNPEFFRDAFAWLEVREVARGEANLVSPEVRRNGPEECGELAAGFVFMLGARGGFAAGAVAMFCGVRWMGLVVGQGGDSTTPGPVFLGALDGVGKDRGR